MDTRQGLFHIEEIRWQGCDEPLGCALDEDDGCPRFRPAEGGGSSHIGVSNTPGSQRLSPSE